MILELNHIYKDYVQGSMVVPVLKDVTLHVEEGEYVAIMGPSGSGKSTLMNIVGCLDLPTKGEYRLDGVDVLLQKENELADIRLNKIGFVFQTFQLLPEFPRRSGTGSRRRRLTEWVYPTVSRSSQTSCQEGRNRGWRLPGLW